MSNEFSALRISLRFYVPFEDEDVSNEHSLLKRVRPTDSYARYDRLNSVHCEIEECLLPVLRHVEALGGIRADSDEDDTPQFYLIIHGDPDRDTEDPCFAFGRIRRTLESLSGEGIEIEADGFMIDPDEAYSATKAASHNRDVAAWRGLRTLDLLPAEGEPYGSWLERVAVPSDRVRADLDVLSKLNCDIDLYRQFFDPAAAENPEWLVEGVIGFGVLTLLVGGGAAGKSSAAQELLAVTMSSEPNKAFLGRQVNGRFISALLCGEETDGVIKFRQERLSKRWPDSRFLIFRGASPSALNASLERLESVPGKGLLVVDPAQTYIEGDDTKSHVVSEFYAPLVDFARRKNWAVVVVAHLVKGAPSNLAGILVSVKGSTVHTDRARMVIAMLDRKNGTVQIGPIKHNFPSEMVWSAINEGRYYRRDAETFTLTPIEADIPKVPPAAQSTLDRICAAIERFNQSGVVVHRTGRSSLFKLAAELAGLSRASIDEAILELLERRCVIDTECGLVLVRSQDERLVA